MRAIKNRFVMAAFVLLAGTSQMCLGLSQEDIDTDWIKSVGTSNDIESILEDTKEQLVDLDLGEDEIGALMKDVDKKLTEQSKNASQIMRLEVRIGISNGVNGKKRTVLVEGSSGNLPPNVGRPRTPQIPANPGLEAMKQLQESMHRSMQRHQAFGNQFPGSVRSYSIGAKLAESSDPRGVRIDGLSSDKDSKLEIGDIVTMANGFKVKDVTTLNELVAIAGRTDQSIALTVLREGKDVVVNVTPTNSGIEQISEIGPQRGMGFGPPTPPFPRSMGPTNDARQLEKLQLELQKLRDAVDKLQTDKRIPPKA
ncbi:MAG: PDZ domain-containing protein [Pirellula sp.]|jgi:hypothetical protein|nr:PDZ domain-containing protein [Pirellula sp.]